jgi:sugar lactone lactonase YvrE
MKILSLLLLTSIITLSCINQKIENKLEVSLVDSTQNALGEGAIWDGPNNRLFYIDIIGKKLFEFYPESDKKIIHEMPSMIGTVVIKNDNEVLVALEDGIYSYHLDSRKLDYVICPPENDSTQRFNDGKCDPAGRFWVGTMSLIGGKEKSNLFCLNNDGSISMKLDGVTISNGIVWSSDKKHMYYIDTPTRQVMEYKYDITSGDITEPRVAIQVPDSLGSPDGMAIDNQDNLWVCMWGGSAVCCFDRETGELIDKIEVPAKNVTSCAFSGKGLNELYITSARVGTSKNELSNFPYAGGLFKISLKNRGLEANRYFVNK